MEARSILASSPKRHATLGKGEKSEAIPARIHAGCGIATAHPRRLKRRKAWLSARRPETLLKLRRRVPGSVKNTHNLQWSRVRYVYYQVLPSYWPEPYWFIGQVGTLVSQAA